MGALESRPRPTMAVSILTSEWAAHATFSSCSSSHFEREGSRDLAGGGVFASLSGDRMSACHVFSDAQESR